ncbi:hypothetical protein GIB67_002292 [Kingdonia uniflora]|uniref:Uncharacterized protein n=1 Tax=Kingdonia uniflora TaxID=39325 RepID=A0A7J7KWZ8_9MAGN|nr:hypothetical protein GIB67_002292 [Kingdonia uniflora]
METIQRRFVNLSMNTTSYGKWDSNRTMLLKLWQCMTMIQTRHLHIFLTVLHDNSIKSCVNNDCKIYYFVVFIVELFYS